MTVQIQVRRDTAANWTAANPTLVSGEYGFETDTYKMKIGDGSTDWNSLAYFSATAYNTISEEGSNLTQRTVLNIIGSGLTAADDTTRTNITLDALLNSIADLTATSGTLEITGSNTAGTYTVTTFAKTYLDDTNATDTRSTLGLGSAATQASTVFAQVANNLSDLASTSTARTNLGLGTAATLATTVFAQVANNLSDLANTATARTNLGLGTSSTRADTFFAQVANNLSDLASTSTARTNLGLGTSSTRADTFFAQVANNLSDMANTGTARTNINAQIGIAFQDESVTTGTTGAISTVNFIGSGVTASATGSTLTVSVSGGGDVTAAASIGDNRLVRGDGGAKGIQQSGITIDDSNNMTGVADIEASSLYTTGNITTDGNLAVSTAITMTGGSPYISGVNIIEFNGTSGVLSAGDTANEKLLIRAQDTDGGADVSFITLTSNPTPTCDLDDSVTKNGQYIYRAGGTNVAVADGGTGADDATTARSNLSAQVSIAFQDEGTITGTTGAINTVNFVGAGVSATAAANTLTVTISGGGASGYQTIQEEGSGLTQRNTVNFIGSGITAADDAGNTRTNITLDALLNAIADVTATSGTLEMTGTDTVGTYTVTTFAKTYLDDTNVTNTRSTLGLGSAALSAATSFAQVANDLSDLASTSTARTNLGLGTAATRATTFFAQVANNLSDMAATATARANIGAAATSQTTEYIAALIQTPTNTDYALVGPIPHGGTITKTFTKCVSGTGTAQFKVNTTALGGGTNTVSSTQNTTTHSTTNTFSAGDTISLTMSSVSSVSYMNFLIQYTRTYS